MLSKFCHKCQQNKNFNEFGKDNHRKDKLTTACKLCRNKQNKDYFQKNPELKKKINDAHKEYRQKYYRNEKWQKKLRDIHLKETFNLTQADYDKMLLEQNGVCSICKQFRTQVNKIYMHIDHCHKTGKIRGLLCYYCNAGLGWFQDNPESLQSAIQYLKENKNV